jgi:hypothetical protein
MVVDKPGLVFLEHIWRRESINVPIITHLWEMASRRVCKEEIELK